MRKQNGSIFNALVSGIEIVMIVLFMILFWLGLPFITAILLSIAADMEKGILNEEIFKLLIVTAVFYNALIFVIRKVAKFRNFVLLEKIVLNTIGLFIFICMLLTFFQYIELATMFTFFYIIYGVIKMIEKKSFKSDEVSEE